MTSGAARDASARIGYRKYEGEYRERNAPTDNRAAARCHHKRGLRPNGFGRVGQPRDNTVARPPSIIQLVQLPDGGNWS